MRAFLGTAHAAKWTGFSERHIRTWCEQGRLEGAYQFQRNGKWLIPAVTLEKICPCPKWLAAELADTAELA
jgi:hypothetical protein